MFGLEEELQDEINFYKNLLYKYAKHVDAQEGITFIGSVSKGTGFSDKEIKELEIIDKKI